MIEKTSPEFFDKRLKQRCYILAWGALALSLVVVLLSLATGKLPRGDILYDADTLYLPALYQDIVNGTDLSGWRLATNPYFFPDMIFYFALNWLFGNIHFAIVSYGLIQSVLWVVGLLALSSYLFRSNLMVQSLLLLVSAIFFLTLAIGQYFELVYILQTVFHAGILTLIPFSIILLLQLIKQRNVALNSVLLVIIATIATISDIFYAIWFLLPALGGIFCLYLLSRVVLKQVISLALILLTPVVAWAIFNQISGGYKNVSVYTDASESTRQTAALAFWQWLESLSSRQPVFVWVWIGFLAIIVWVTIRLYSRRHQPISIHTHYLFLLIFIIGLLVSNPLIVIVSGNFTDVNSTRYLIPFLFVPIFWGWPFLMAANEKLASILSKRRSILGLCVINSALIGFILLAHGHQVTALSALADYEPDYMGCLDREAERRGLKNGLAYYWLAKPISMLSKQNIQVVQVTSGLDLYHWVNNLAWYDIAPDFIIVDTIVLGSLSPSEKTIIAHFGSPADRFQCDHLLVLVYNRPSDILFRNWTKHHPHLAQLDKPEANYEFFGAMLPSFTGQPIGLSRGIDDVYGPTMLTYGPYVTLSKGRYAFEIHYYAEQQSDKYGNWGVLADEADQGEVLIQGDIILPGKNMISDEFALEDDRIVDVHTVYSGQGVLFVDKVILKRIPEIKEDRTFANKYPKPHLYEPGQLNLIIPPNATLVDSNQRVDLVWEWTGQPLAENQAFEVRLWHRDDPAHYGAHDAKAAKSIIRQIGHSYILRLSLNGTHSFNLHQADDYFWTVALVEVEPTYRDLEIEAEAQSITIRQPTR